MNSVLPLFISFISGVSTVIGGLIASFNVKDKNSFLSFVLSFSLSVMISVSIFDLLPYSFNVLYINYGFAWAIILGVGVFYLGYTLIKNINKKFESFYPRNNLYRVGVLSMIVLMIHNFPEGIATFISSYNDLSVGISLALVIMLHNIPEGISISCPIYYATGSRALGVFYSFLAGFAEPIGALLAFLFLKKFISDITISIVLVFVSGIMITLAIDETFSLVSQYDNKKYELCGYVLGVIIVLVTVLI